MMNTVARDSEVEVKNRDLYEKCFTVRKRGLALVAENLPENILVIATENVNRLSEKIDSLLERAHDLNSEEGYENFLEENKHKLIRIVNSEWEDTVRELSREISLANHKRNLEKEYLAEIIDMSNTEDVMEAYSTLKAKFDAVNIAYNKGRGNIKASSEFFRSFKDNLAEKSKRREMDEVDEIEDQLDDAVMILNSGDICLGKVA